MDISTLPKRYEVRSLLGEGGQGRVYRVQDSIRDRVLALKLVTPAESAFLRREFDTLRQIRHENLIQVFDWGTLPGGEAYYTMELMEGGAWSARMGKPQPADEVRHILTGVLRGLAHLHCHGEIHGDLKPENILLGAGGVVKITDTGMGGRGGSGSGKSGTPGYAAPEVWEGASPNVRSDLYSVGVMAYEALTGTHPFAGRTVREVVSGQLEGWVASPGAHGSPAPADLERVVMRALERQPGLRYGSADEFMESFGVESRIGEILGGKLVDREKQIAEIENLVNAGQIGTPTLLYVTGEPGIGKTALMEEVIYRAGSTDATTIRIENCSEQLVRRALGFAFQQGSLETMSSASSLATSVYELSKRTRLLVWIDSQSETMESDTWVRAFCRTVWAIGIERQDLARILFVITSGQPKGKEEEFERRVSLPALSKEQTSQLCDFVLGRTDLAENFISRVFSLTGGNPGAVRSCIAFFVDRSILARIDGTWAFRETEQVQEIALPPGMNPWTLAWSYLDEVDREILVALALAPSLRGPTDVLKEADPVAHVARLEAKGWIRSHAGRLYIASQLIHQAVLTQADESIRRRIALLLLTSTASLPREDRADLALQYDRGKGAIEDGVWAADEAIRRGEYRTAARRLKACLELTDHDASKSFSVSMKLAEVLHQLGEDNDALFYIDGSHFISTPLKSADEAYRAKMLGQIESAQGRIEDARRHLLIAAELAENAGQKGLALESHAALAELEWRHESDSVRAASIVRVREILKAHAHDVAGADERANLTYQLGAALIMRGDFSEARQVLESGKDLKCSAYWQMRLANARASADYYEGNFDSALEWMNEAWVSAERAGADSFRARLLMGRAGVLYGLGRPREAVDQHRVAALWARRNGNPFEYLSGCSGVSINQFLLAHYEEAIQQAIETRRSAQRIGDVGEEAKGIELEGLAQYYVGDYGQALSLADTGLRLLEGRGYDKVRPRLLWLKARLSARDGRFDEAEATLKEAEGILLETRDWEDLPGVQIEQFLLKANADDSRSALGGIRKLLDAAIQRGLIIVELNCARAIAEVILKHRLYHTELGTRLAAALERSDDAGMAETSWWLTYCLGEIALQRGNNREAHTRFRRAIQTLNQIAADLSPAHRELYLARSHTRSALERISSLGN